MPDHSYESKWLHDEDNTITVLPYTTLDNVKIKNENDEFSDFKQDYINLQGQVTNTKTNINNLKRTVNNLGKILYGTSQPNETDGKDGDLYIQNTGDKIEKIWHRVNGEWYAFEGVGGGPTISIGNIDASKKPKINVSIKISNYEGGN